MKLLNFFIPEYFCISIQFGSIFYIFVVLLVFFRYFSKHVNINLLINSNNNNNNNNDNDNDDYHHLKTVIIKKENKTDACSTRKTD